MSRPRMLSLAVRWTDHGSVFCRLQTYRTDLKPISGCVWPARKDVDRPGTGRMLRHTRDRWHGTLDPESASSLSAIQMAASFGKTDCRRIQISRSICTVRWLTPSSRSWSQISIRFVDQGCGIPEER
jgi:hypothetical protein